MLGLHRGRRDASEDVLSRTACGGRALSHTLHTTHSHITHLSHTSRTHHTTPSHSAPRQHYRGGVCGLSQTRSRRARRVAPLRTPRRVLRRVSPHTTQRPHTTTTHTTHTDYTTLSHNLPTSLTQIVVSHTTHSTHTIHTFPHTTLSLTAPTQGDASLSL